MNDILKPCPFCGEEAVIIPFIDSFRVGCVQTFICRGANHTSMPYATKEKAIAAWNRRAE